MFDFMDDNQMKFMEAARYGDGRIISNLIFEGVSPDFQDASGTTPLMEAIKHKHFSTAFAILDASFRVDLTDNQGKSALLHLISLKTSLETGQNIYRSDMAIFFIQLRQRDAHFANPLSMDTPILLKAMEAQNRVLVSFMLQWGIHPPKDSLDELVFGASIHGFPDVLLAMLNKGGDINARNMLGRTPLMEAISAGKFGIARDLVKRGANVSVVDSVGANALYILLNTPESYQYLESTYEREWLFARFIKEEPKENISGSKGWKLLKAAIDSENYPHALALFSKGIPIVPSQLDGFLHSIAKTTMENKVEGFKKFINDWMTLKYKLGQIRSDKDYLIADFMSTAMDIKTSSALQLAKTLLKKGAHANSLNQHGNTPLQEAILSKNYLLGEILLEYGAKLQFSLLAKTPDDALDLDLNESKGRLFRAMLKKSSSPYSSQTDLLATAKDAENWTIVRILMEHLVLQKPKAIDAVLHGDVSQLKLLLSKEIDVNERDSSGKTPLMHAVKKGNLDMVKVLVDAGADLFFQDNEGRCAFDLVDAAKHPQIKIHLEEQASPVNRMKQAFNVVGKTFSKTLKRGLRLMYDAPKQNALNLNLMEMVKIPEFPRQEAHTRLILLFGADVNFADPSGERPIMAAIRCGNLQTALLLLNYGADTSLKDGDGKNALQLLTSLKGSDVLDEKTEKFDLLYKLLSAREDSRSLTDKVQNALTENLLLSKNTSPTPVSKKIPQDTSQEMKKSLFDAVQDNDFFEMKERIREGDPIDVTTDTGRTPLMKAIEKGHLRIAAFLVDAGANVHHADALGVTALHLLSALPASADEQNHPLSRRSLLEKLLDAGADLTRTDGMGNTPASTAIEADNISFGTKLIEMGYNAPFDLRDANGHSPLMKAASNGNAMDVAQLIEKGADVFSLDKGGKTCLDHAIINSRFQVASLLIQKNKDIPLKEECLLKLQNDLVFVKNSVSPQEYLALETYVLQNDFTHKTSPRRTRKPKFKPEAIIRSLPRSIVTSKSIVAPSARNLRGIPLR